MNLKPRILLNIALSIGLLCLASSAAWVMYACRRQPARRAARKVVPKVLAPPIQARLSQNVKIVGNGSARPHVQLIITPQVTGIVVAKAPNFFSGRYVRKGQVLLRIDQTDYSFAVRRAGRHIDLLKAQLAHLNQEEKNLKELEEIDSGRVKLAAEQLDKVVKLLEAGAGSENEVDVATETLLTRKGQLRKISNQLALIEMLRRRRDAEIASAEVDLAQAKVNLDRCTIKSPVAGRVLNCRVEVGQLVQVGSDCGQIYGTDVMEVPVSVPASDLGWLDRDLLEMCKSGDLPPDPARCIKALIEWQQPNDGQTITWEGCVERVEAGLEAQTRMAALVVRVENPRPKNPTTDRSPPNEGRPMLEVNMFCKVTVFGRKLPKVYVLPREAVLPNGSVYVVADSRLQRRPVKVARFSGEEAMILPNGGIGDGDRVVIGTVARPVIGMKVEPVDSLLSGT